MTAGDLIGLVLTAAGVAAVLALAALTERRHCPDSKDGEHEDITVRTPDGFCRQCIRCARMTKGVAAFHRKAS